MRFSNPFRFYLTVSVVFFLVLGIGKSVDKFRSYSEAQHGKKEKDSVALVEEKTDVLDNINTDSIVLKNLTKKSLTQQELSLIHI